MGTGSPLFARDRKDDLHEPLEQAEFTLLASPSGSVDVLTRRGESLGSFGTAALLEGAGLPEPLLPLSRHPLSNVHSLDAGYALDLLVVPNSVLGQELRAGRSTRLAALTWDAKFKLDEYFIRVSLEKHYLGACIKRNAWHVGALVHHLPRSTLSPRSNNLAFDLHIASWWDQRRPCFAVYESKTRFCRNLCRHPTWDAVVVVVYAALAVGMVAWLAWAIASAIAAAVVGGLIVIPGVPPPP